MKKLLCVVIMTIIVLSTTVFTACTDKTPDAISSEYEDLAKSGEFVKGEGGAGDKAVFDFGKKVKINTVVLKEKDSSITSFRLYADDDNTPIYGNDFIDGYRYCTFETVELSKITVEVLSAEGEWKLKELEAYLIEGGNEDFRIMSYIYADTAYRLTDEQKVIAQNVTDFNVFGCTYFDSKGEIKFVDYEIDGVKYSGQDVLKGAVRNLRENCPSASVVVTVLGNRDFGDGLTTVERHNSAMDAHKDKLTENLVALIEDYGLDGVSFDYEYPEKNKDFNVFADYLKELDKAIGKDKLLTAAISEWCIKWFGYSASDFDPLDSIEIMSYDLFDKRGNHADFYNSCYTVLKKLQDKGVDLSKVNFGLPFYSRPVNKDSYWGSYCNVAEQLSPYENTYVEAYTDLDGVQHDALANYYNGRQMIYDKTRYAMDCGAGGVMIWHFGCDSTDPGLSLIEQIAAAKRGEYII